MHILGPIALIISSVVALIFPFYFILFVVRAIRSRRLGPASGTSLLTLVLFLAIITPLFSIPVDKSIKTKRHRRTAEAKHNLNIIFHYQTVYQAEHAAYAGAGGEKNAFELLGYSPLDQSVYAYFCGESALVNTRDNAIDMWPGGDLPFSFRSEVKKGTVVQTTIMAHAQTNRLTASVV